jgi:hypothetical protein
MRDPGVIRAYLGGGLATPEPSMPLPPALPLPVAAAALAGLGQDLAERAGRIRAAHTLAVRQAGTLPSAFVGRYDPKAVGDPWAGVAVAAAPRAPKPAEPARRLAAEAATMAARAAERLAAHVTSTRLSAPRPSGFRQLQLPPEPVPEAPPAQPDAPGIGHNSAVAAQALSPAALAERAAMRHSAHVSERRKTLTAFLIPARSAGKADPDPKPH